MSTLPLSSEPVLKRPTPKRVVTITKPAPPAFVESVQVAANPAASKKSRTAGQVPVKRKMSAKYEAYKRELFEQRYGPLLPYVGQRVVVQLKRGVIYQGLLLEISDPWLIFSDAKIIGTIHTAHVSDIAINVKWKDIRHIHLDEARVERIKRLETREAA